MTARAGFHTRTELVEEYAKQSGRDVSAIEFYQALAYYKLAVIAEGIHARFLQGKTVGEGFTAYGTQVEELVERGLEVTQRSAAARLPA